MSLSNNKKGGFGTVIPMFLGLFFLVFLFYAAYFGYTAQINSQIELLEKGAKNSPYAKEKIDFSLNPPSVYSGKTIYELENSGAADIRYKSNSDIFCFDIFSKNHFFDKNSKFFYPDKVIQENSYKIIEKNSNGILYLKNKDLINQPLSLTSCNEISKNFEFNKSQYYYWDLDWKKREQITIEGTNKNLYEYQIQSSFNKSTIDFSEIRKNDIRSVMSLHHYLVLDTPFDSYSQNIEDFSKNNYSTTLGDTSSNEATDPSKGSDFIFSSLRFNGSQFAKVSSFNSLNNSQQATLSLWIKNVSQSSGTLLYNENLFNISFNEPNPGEVSVTWSRDGIWEPIQTFSLNQQNSQWRLLTIKFNAGETCVAIGDTIITCNNQTLKTIGGDSLSNTYIGGLPNSDSGFNGEIDEVKLYSIALRDEEIEALSRGKPLFRELDFYINDLDFENQQLELYSKIPKIPRGTNLNYSIYYHNQNSVESKSNIQSTFSYTIPRRVGYVTSERIADTTGMIISSLQDNNSIEIGTNSLNLNSQESSTFSTTQLLINTSIKATNHLQAEGDGDLTDAIVPLSWAGENFSYSGFRAPTDTLCFISPFGIANVTTQYENGGTQTRQDTVTNSGLCIDIQAETNQPTIITSDIPILASYTGSSGQDSFILYPSSSKNLYGVPSQNIYLATSDTSASGTIQESDGSFNTFSITSSQVYNDGSFGADGTSNAVRVSTDNSIGVTQQADSDGTETSVFTAEHEFGRVFGSPKAAEYLTIVSTHRKANCRVYDSTKTLVDSQNTGIGGDNLYKYEFGTGNSNQFVGSNWLLECEKPVWLYYEKASQGDETQVLGEIQMRQYSYPEPQVVIE